jgi:hypothetical protein
MLTASLAHACDSDGTAVDNKGGPHDYPDLRLNVGLALRDLGRYAEARTELQHAAERNHPDAMVELAILKFTGKGGPELRESAMDDFARSVAAAKEYPDAARDGRQPEFPLQYRRDQAAHFIKAVRERGLGIKIMQGGA